jgi:hypothetical protein
MVEPDIITVARQWDLMMMMEMKKITAMIYRISQGCLDKIDWDALKAMYFLSRWNQRNWFMPILVTRRFTSFPPIGILLLLCLAVLK